MVETDRTGEQPVIFLRNEMTNSWEERSIRSPQASRRVGSTVLKCLKQPKLYAYADALATLVLTLDHLHHLA